MTNPILGKLSLMDKVEVNSVESDTWKFYLAGPAQVNFAPFPAELTSPISGSTVTPSDGLIQVTMDLYRC